MKSEKQTIVALGDQISFINSLSNHHLKTHGNSHYGIVELWQLYQFCTKNTDKR